MTARPRAASGKGKRFSPESGECPDPFLRRPEPSLAHEDKRLFSFASGGEAACLESAPAVKEGGKAFSRKLETGETSAGRSRLVKGPAGRRIEYRKCRRLFSTQIRVRADAAPAVPSIREWREGKWRKGIGLGRICGRTGLVRGIASPYFLINVKIGKVIDPGRFRRTMYGITPNRGYADFPVGRHRPLEIRVLTQEPDKMLCHPP